MLPRLSVIIPCRNALDTLPRAVASALALPIDRFEVIVVDDGSTDGTGAWLAELAARDPRVVPLRRDAEHGVSAARNAGIVAARAPVLGFLDADDVWYAGAIGSRLEWHEAHPETVLSFSDYMTLLPDGALQPRHRASWPRFSRFVDGRSGMLPLGTAAFSLLVGENPVCTSSVLASRAAVQAAGGFDPGLRQAEDWDLWIRLARQRAVAASTTVELLHADWPGSLSHDVVGRIGGIREVVRRHRAEAWRRSPRAALAALCLLEQAEAELARHTGHLGQAFLHSMGAAACHPSVEMARGVARAALTAAGLMVRPGQWAA
nr:glycosyltransferase family 2 protein [uncultured Rhodopila sp.]